MFKIIADYYKHTFTHMLYLEVNLHFLSIVYVIIVVPLAATFYFYLLLLLGNFIGKIFQ